MEYGYIENSMGLQEGYDPSMYNVGFSSEFMHVSWLTSLLIICLDMYSCVTLHSTCAWPLSDIPVVNVCRVIVLLDGAVCCSN